MRRTPGGFDPRPDEPGESLLDQLWRAARVFYGVPYVFGGKDVGRDGGLDCSGFICQTFRAIGIDLGDPDYTDVQRIYEQCEPVPSPLPGDLIFFTDTYNDAQGRPVKYSHIAIIKAPQPVGLMVDAHSNRGVGETDYKTEYWQGHYLDFRAVPGLHSRELPAVGPWTNAEIASVTGCPLANVEAHWPLILQALADRNQHSARSLAGALGTIAIETGSTFAPVDEAYWLSPAARLAYYLDTSQHAEYQGGPQFHGRGFIQLTHDYNYQAAGDAIGVDLLHDPDLAMQPDIAAKVFAWYWWQRDIQEPANRLDWREVRRRVQGGSAGLDRLIRIATALLG